eukprot:m.236836 g.236836  ORF g.236836 m.236836 type:complete len:247 (-) comp20788_c0_seq1:23-763(-)
MALSEEHTQAIVDYLRFARYKRAQRLRAVDAAFVELKESRLMEDTFTADEVAGMLEGLGALLHADVETELIDSAHSNVILLRQMFTEAEKWHLKLKPDISLLEHKDLLAEIAQFEKEQFAPTAAGKSTKLAPLAEAASPALLQQEMTRVKDEAAKQVAAATAECGSLRKQLAEAKARPAPAAAAAPPSAGNEKLLNAEIESLRKELAAAHADLDKKFADTTQFANMKKMLETKNTQIKELRAQLDQ